MEDFHEAKLHGSQNRDCSVLNLELDWDSRFAGSNANSVSNALFLADASQLSHPPFISHANNAAYGDARAHARAASS